LISCAQLLEFFANDYTIAYLLLLLKQDKSKMNYDQYFLSERATYIQHHSALKRVTWRTIALNLKAFKALAQD
jgi:hypothetical protein